MTRPRGVPIWGHDRSARRPGVQQEHLDEQIASFVGVITALIPQLGYANAARLAKQALATDTSVADLVVASKLMTREEVTALLTVEHLTGHRPDASE